MIKGIDHVAIAVGDIEVALETFRRAFGVEPTHRETIEEYATETATLDVGNTCIEFVEGKGPDSAIGKYVQKRGPGIHHIALEVEDLASAIAALTRNGVEMIDAVPRRGKDDSLVAFVHPRSTGKILYELVQPRRKP